MAEESMEVETKEVVPEEAAAAAEGETPTKKRKLLDLNYQPPLLASIATPLAEEHLSKRVFKLVTEATQAKQIRRGVKEVMKSIRKEKNPESKKRLCVLAGDITPIDVISHIPVLCEENSIPYIFVRSRAVLGQSARTKRPTSVVLITLPLDSNSIGLYDRCEKKIKALQPSFA